jgi:hypothetical protein
MRTVLAVEPNAEMRRAAEAEFNRIEARRHGRHVLRVFSNVQVSSTSTGPGDACFLVVRTRTQARRPRSHAGSTAAAVRCASRARFRAHRIRHRTVLRASRRKQTAWSPDGHTLAYAADVDGVAFLRYSCTGRQDAMKKKMLVGVSALMRR